MSDAREEIVRLLNMPCEPFPFWLEDDPSTHFLSGGKVQSRMLTMVFGEGTLGKLWPVSELAVAIAGGGSWRGSDVPNSGRVLFVDLLFSPKLLHDRFRRICEQSGEAGRRAMHRLYVLPWRSVAVAKGAIASEILDEVERQADDLNVDVVILEGVHLLPGWNEQDPESVRSVMRRIARLRSRYAVVFSDPYGNNYIDKDPQWVRFADAVIRLSPAAVKESELRIIWGKEGLA
jgi:hypothetical protein